MNKSPRLTVISLYYNRPNGVTESIQSLIDQDYVNYNIIVLDDGSTDNTLDTLKTLRDSRLEIRTQSNLGFTRSIKKIMDSIDTEFVAVHGSGDISHPSRLRVQVEALDADPGAVMCATASRTIDPVTGLSIGTRSFPRTKLYRDDLAETTPFTHGTVMYRRAAYAAAGGYEPLLKWCADWELWLRMLQTGHAHYIQEVMYDRIAQEDGASFHPTKSLEQIKCKRLALKLGQLSADDRASTVEILREHGLDRAVASEAHLVARDLARRQLKLRLMGRRSPAAELARLAASEGYINPPLIRLLSILADACSKAGLSPEELIRLGRRIIRRPAGSQQGNH